MWNLLRLLNNISLPGLADGPSPSAAPVGLMTDLFGQPLCPASRSARRGSAKASMTSGTSGPPSRASCASAVLSASLASRYRARTASLGSTLYRLTWKTRVTPSGRLISALRASAPRIGVTVSIGPLSGWTTPQRHDTNPRGVGNRQNPNGGNACLAWDVRLAGWATPAARDWKSEKGFTPDPAKGNSLSVLPRQAALAGWATPRSGNNAGFGNPDRPGGPNGRLEDLAALAGWASPTAQDGERGGLPPRPQDTGVPLSQQVAEIGPARLTASGQVLIGSAAGMENGGQLNPRFSLWLQGFGIEWALCAEAVTRSTYQRRKRSSAA